MVIVFFIKVRKIAAQAMLFDTLAETRFDRKGRGKLKIILQADCHPDAAAS